MRAFGRDQLPFVGNVAVVAVEVFGAWFLAEDETLPGGMGHDVVLGASVGEVTLRCLHHQSVHHLVVRAFVVEVARVVELFEPVGGEVDDAWLLCVIAGCLVDGDYVEVGLVVPVAPRGPWW